MVETVSGSDPEPQVPRPGDAVLDAPQVCLRCDWTGEADSGTCPRCGARLYRSLGSTQPIGDGDAPPAVPAADSRRRWEIVAAVTVAAFAVAATGVLFDRLRAPSGSPTVSPAADPATTDDVLRRGDEVLMLEGSDLVAVDPGTGESRTLLDLGEGTDPPTAVGGEAVTRFIGNAAWSPDGRWVAFDGRRAALWVMNAEMDIRRLVRGAYGGWVWSPTEARLAMILDSKLTVVEASTGRTIDLGEVIGDVTSPPVWSPDGTRLVYGARGGSLYSVDAQSGERSLLVRLPGENLDSMDEIEWSPDGARLAIMNDLGPGGGRLYVMNADGSGVRVLVNDYEPGGVAWSPDGRSLAYAAHESRGDEPADRLWTVSPVEGTPLAIAANTSITSPVWSPDGSRIAFVGSMDARDWYAVDADGAGSPAEIDELVYLSWRGGPIV